MRFLANENVSLDAIVVAAAIESRTDWTGHFTVVEEHRIRMRPLLR